MDEELRNLVEKREAMEKRAEEIKDYLCGEGQPGLSGGLDDAEGYPRGDIDIIKIVEHRHELACLNTDYTELMKLIEQKLKDVHSKSSVHVPRQYPFAVITQILPNGNAQTAGLQTGDILTTFGPFNVTQRPGTPQYQQQLNRIFQSIPDHLQKAQHPTLPVTVQRNHHTLSFDLPIKPSLGLKLDPYIPNI